VFNTISFVMIQLFLDFASKMKTEFLQYYETLYMAMSHVMVAVCFFRSLRLIGFSKSHDIKINNLQFIWSRLGIIVG
jgi:hypothetical protein